MASPVALTIGDGCSDPDAAFATVRAVFRAVEAQCTRFDPDSDLMRANRRGTAGTEVGRYCLSALHEAAVAHHATAGRFDPRVLGALVDLGYAESVETGRSGGLIPSPHVPSYVWAPRFDHEHGRVTVGATPVDLGGIAKGLAVRWAGEAISGQCPSFLLDAGGDLLTRGASPDGGPWRIGIEDPRGGDDPVAVIALTDAACVTSSTRHRAWQHDGHEVHHLIDPTTGRPGGAGLRAVTVVGADPAHAEVWSKAFFLAGADGIAELVDRQDAAALWVRTDGSVEMSALLRPLVIWTAPW